MPSLQSHLFCALTENPLARHYLHRRNHDWTDPVEVIREGVEKAMADAKLPEGIEVEVLQGTPVPMEWVFPSGSNRDRALIYFHGGGYVIGSAKSSRHLISKIVKASGIPALSVDYRLAPENPPPAGVEDGVTAYQWLLDQGYAPENVALIGDSGGGGMVLATLLLMKEKKIPLPSVGVCMSPCTDFTGSAKSMITQAKKDPFVTRKAWEYFRDRYVGNQDPKSPLISPLYGDHRGLPPIMIHVGDHEIGRDESTMFAQRAQEAGVDVTVKVWPNMCHVFPALANIFPEGKEAIAEMTTFLNEHVKDRRS